MRWVPHAAMAPHRCAAIPFIGNSTGRKGFIDTNCELPGWDPHVYVSVEAVEEMARMIGWAPNFATEQAQRKADNLAAQVADKNDEIKALQEQLAAVETLRNAGFKGRERKVAA